MHTIHFMQMSELCTNLPLYNYIHAVYVKWKTMKTWDAWSGYKPLQISCMHVEH